MLILPSKPGWFGRGMCTYLCSLRGRPLISSERRDAYLRNLKRPYLLASLGTYHAVVWVGVKRWGWNSGAPLAVPDGPSRTKCGRAKSNGLAESMPTDMGSSLLVHFECLDSHGRKPNDRSLD